MTKEKKVLNFLRNWTHDFGNFFLLPNVYKYDADNNGKPIDDEDYIKIGKRTVEFLEKYKEHKDEARRLHNYISTKCLLTEE